MALPPETDANDLEVQVANVLGINVDQAKKGSLRIDVSFDAMKVTWECFAMPTEEQRDQIMAIISSANVAAG